jgi:ABC-type nickel/cobalt efflux system permease component RcnA
MCDDCAGVVMQFVTNFRLIVENLLKYGLLLKFDGALWTSWRAWPCCSTLLGTRDTHTHTHDTHTHTRTHTHTHAHTHTHTHTQDAHMGLPPVPINCVCGFGWLGGG